MTGRERVARALYEATKDRRSCAWVHLSGQSKDFYLACADATLSGLAAMPQGMVRR
jgi:hypothetical protein